MRKAMMLSMWVAGLLLWGCSQDPPVAYSEGPGAQVVAKLASAAQSADLARVVLVVSGEGIDPPIELSQEITGRSRTFAFEDVEVLAGLERNFAVRGEDAAGEVIYEGSETVDIQVGSAPEISILMLPTRFTLLVTPSEITVSAGSEFALDVWVYHIQELFGVSFEVEYDPGRLNALSAEVGDFLESEVQLVKIEEGRVSVSVVKTRGEAPLSGSGRLARLNFRADEPGETALRFVEEALTLQRADGTEVSGREAMIVGEARVVVQ